MSNKWCINQGEEVDSHLRWVDDSGSLVDVSIFTSMTVELRRLHSDEVLASFALTEDLQTIDGVEYQIGVKFMPILPPGSYGVLFVFSDGVNPPIKQRSSTPLTIKT